MKTAMSKTIACLVLSGATALVTAGETTNPYGDAAGQHKQTADKSALSRLSPDDLEGMDIYDSNGEQLGDVDAVVKDLRNQHMIVIGLEDDMKEVAVPIDKLALSANGERITTRLTRNELLAMPDYDPMDMESVDD